MRRGGADSQSRAPDNAAVWIQRLSGTKVSASRQLDAPERNELGEWRCLRRQKQELFPSPKRSMPERTKGQNVSRLSLQHDALGLFGRRFECAFPDRHRRRPQNYHVRPSIQIDSPQISLTPNTTAAKQEERSDTEKDKMSNYKQYFTIHDTFCPQRLLLVT